MSTTVSRRSLVKGAAVGAAALGAAAAMTTTSAMADEPADSYTYADTIDWYAEYDVVVLGMGFAGMAAAIEAADNGAEVLLCDKCTEGQSGGNSRVCGQAFAYGYEDVDTTMLYYKSLAGGRDIPEDLLMAISEGIAHLRPTMAEKYGLDESLFSDGRDFPEFAWATPEYPELPGSEGITWLTAHDGMFDSFLFQSIRTDIAENYAGKIDVWFESPGVSLIQDPVSKTVIGVNIDRNGESRSVRALNGVCICTGGFEDDPEMVQNYLNVINYAPIGGLYNTGDGIKMCQAIGAKLWHMDVWEGLGDPFGMGYAVPEGMVAPRGLGSDMVVGATVVVGDWGRRMGNESYASRHGKIPGGNGIWVHADFPQKYFIVWDKTQYDTFMESGSFNDNYTDLVVECATMADVADVIGCDEANIQKTIDDFNMFAEMGEDYECGRDADTMRAFDGEAYYVMPLKALILNTQGGPETTADLQIVDTNDDPIPNLYSAGEIGFFISCMYQGGTNVGGCFVAGQIAGANAATPKDPLPAYTAASKIESNPKHIGEDADTING